MRRGSYLGASCTVRERVTLGAWSVVGMGANVLEDVAGYEVVVGNPARVKDKLPDRWEEPCMIASGKD